MDPVFYTSSSHSFVHILHLIPEENMVYFFFQSFSRFVLDFLLIIYSYKINIYGEISGDVHYVMTVNHLKLTTTKKSLHGQVDGALRFNSYGL